MDTILILTWVSIFAGGALIFLLLLSLAGGIDLELDLDMGSTDVDADAGGLGWIKGGLTFFSVSTWVIRVMLLSAQHPAIAIGLGIAAGLGAFWVLHAFLKFLIQQEENVNWTMQDAVNQTGEVYLRIPGGEDNGLVQVEIKGAIRELKAKSHNQTEIKTGDRVQVVEVEDDYVLVSRQS